MIQHCTGERAACREGLATCVKERLDKERVGRATDRQADPSSTVNVTSVCDTCQRSFRRRQRYCQA